VIFTSKKPVPVLENEVALVDVQPDFDYNHPFEKMLTISIPHATRQNGSLHLHLFTLLRPEHQPDTHNWDFWRLRQDPVTVYTRIKLTQYHVAETTTIKLLEGGGSNKLKKD
jgi:hypothetical protein